jgi:DNA-binding transcriptional ArsR family regulator
MTRGSEKVIEEGLIVLHPERWKLIKALREIGKPLFIGEIADKLGMERRLVSYHLATLEQHGFVISEFKIIEPPHSKGKAGRFFQLTNKADEIIPKLIEALKD